MRRASFIISLLLSGYLWSDAAGASDLRDNVQASLACAASATLQHTLPNGAPDGFLPTLAKWHYDRVVKLTNDPDGSRKAYLAESYQWIKARDEGRAHDMALTEFNYRCWKFVQEIQTVET